MYYVMKMSNRFYSTEFKDIYDDRAIEYLDSMATDGTPVLVCADLDDAADVFNINVEEIQNVEIDE